MENSEERKLFEDKVFSEYYIRNIQRNYNPPQPKISGALDFVPGKIMNKADFLARDERGNYKQSEVSAMWFGWNMYKEMMVGQEVLG